jgi:subtilisin family serine protease
LRKSWRQEQNLRAGLSSAVADKKKTRRRVLLRLSGDGTQPLPEGIRLFSQRGELATGIVDLDLLPRVAASPAVQYIRAERLIQPCDDPGVLSIRARRVRPKLDITGRGVLIGIIDSGIDWRHPDFRKPDGSTRIAAILDLSFSEEEREALQSEYRGPYNGVLITAGQIDQALADSGDLPHRDYLGHGTHCAGTAAATDGISSVGLYGGVAPEAGIIAVKVSPTQRDSVFSDASILNGLEFIDSLAASLESPYVVNMSFGGSLGPHDGSTIWERYIAGFAEPGPVGHALVVASGNERQKRNHARGDFAANPGGSVVLELQVNGRGSENDEMRVEIWLSSGHTGTRLTLVTPGGDSLGPFEDGYGNEGPEFTDEGILLIENAFGGPDPDAGDRLISVEFYDDQAGEPDTVDDISIATGAWKIIMEAESGSFDAYVYGTRGLQARFGSLFTETGSVTEPGTCPEVITVGAYTSRTDWNSAQQGVVSASKYIGGSTPGSLAYFSGLGPNRKEVLKPEVTAPGRWVMASMSGFAWPGTEPLSIYESPYSSLPLLMVGEDSLHGASQGTSFATPHVAGLCALLLEADPALSHARIKDALTETATGDSLATGLPDNYWGYGRANAIGAVRQALGITADSILVAGCLIPQDTIPADSLVFSVAVDFTASAQVLRSFVFNVSWPEDYLYLKEMAVVSKTSDSLAVSFDSSLLNEGILGVGGYSAAGLAAADTLLRLVLKPRLVVQVDSVEVGLELVELRGDLDPVELEESARLVQAGLSRLAPAACLVTGDVDQDGKANIFDLLKLLELLSGRDTSPSPCADVNGDTLINIFDLLELLKILSGQ